MFNSLKAGGTADKTEVFAEGWLDDNTGTYRGRPVDVAMMKDGSLLVSDHYAGAIYRISYYSSSAAGNNGKESTAPFFRHATHIVKAP